MASDLRLIGSPNHSFTGTPETADPSDDDENDVDVENVESDDAEELSGTLSKWTNYLHGWQDRFMTLRRDGSLSYYKSACEADFGCRGAISLLKASVKAHDIDERRFDVATLNDSCVWYLRAASTEDRQKWMDALERSVARLQRQQTRMQERLGNRFGGSAHSLTSGTYSMSSRGASAGSAKGRGLPEKLAELETFRDILCRQVDTLQSYYDTCSEVAQVLEEDRGDSSGPDVTRDVMVQHGIHAVDFKGEAITFKATTAGILATLSHCIELMNQREGYWKQKFDREHAARKSAEEKFRLTLEHSQLGAPDLSHSSFVAKNGPDFAEGPHSQLGEDEFYDAVEVALDKLEEEQEYRDRLRMMSREDRKPAVQYPVSEAKAHPLWPTIEQVFKEQLHYARVLPGGKNGVWELFAEDGQMRMYKREEMLDDMVVDPLKALHHVKGVTARELTHHFFYPEYRMEWETTLEQATVLERIAPDTLLFLQLHKRIWPAAQRDACFWSHLRKVDPADAASEDGEHVNFHDTWVVCNRSAEHPDAPKNQNGMLRVDLVIIFVCDTIIEESKRGLPLDRLTRDDISSKICYCSVVNPMGWAPASVLRTVYKREYPRFLKRFTQYVGDKMAGKPIMW